jgi:large subunit ribosomal protein L30
MAKAKKAEAGKIKVTLVKSTIAVLPLHKKVVEALGLKKREQVVVKEDNAQMRGIIAKISHLVEVTEIAE